MAKKFLTHIDLNKNQIWNVALHNLATPPSSPVDGQIYYNTANQTIYYWNQTGLTWVALSAASGTITNITAGSGLTGGGSSGSVTLDVNVDNATLEINADIVRIKDLGVTTAKIADSNVTTIKIADNAVTFAKMQDIATMTVMGRVTAASGDPEALALINDNTMATATATNLATAGSIKAYVDSTVAAIGNLEGAFAAATETNFPTGSGGTKKGDYWYVTTAGTVQGVVLNIGDVLVAKIDAASTTLSTDWIFLESNRDQATDTILGVVRLATTAEAQALTNSVAVLTPSTLAQVTATETRTGIAEIATQTEVNTGTDDTRIVTPLKLKTYLDNTVGGYAANVGNAAATSFVLTHNLNTRDVVVAIYDNSTFEEVMTDVVATSTTQVTVSFITAPTTDQYRVVIKK